MGCGNDNSYEPSHKEAAVQRVVDAEAALPNKWAVEYDRLRERRKELWLERVKNVPAIADVMKQLADTRPAFRAQRKTDDHQRY